MTHTHSHNHKGSITKTFDFRHHVFDMRIMIRPQSAEENQAHGVVPQIQLSQK